MVNKNNKITAFESLLALFHAAWTPYFYRHQQFTSIRLQTKICPP